MIGRSDDTCGGCDGLRNVVKRKVVMRGYRGNKCGDNGSVLLVIERYN